MESDYAYGNARLRAMKSRLLNARAYDALITATNLEEVIRLLAQGPYKIEIETALVRHSGMRCVSEALRLSVTRTIGKIKTFFRGRPRELVRVLLGRWDVFNLMTILRGQARGVPADEILDTLVPAGELAVVDLRELSQQPGIHATAGLMAAWHLPYAAPLAAAVRTPSNGDLSGIETRLAQSRYREALTELGDDENDLLVREILQIEIDATNLLTLFRLCRAGDLAKQLQAKYGTTSAAPLLIEGGRLDRRMLEELSVLGDVGSIVRRLEGTPYEAILSTRMDKYRQTGNPAVLQRALEEFLVRKGVQMFHRDPLTIAIPIGYITAKSNEVVNVRLISQAKMLDLDWEAIREELIWLTED